MSKTPPEAFFRIEWDEGFGFPTVERRERTSRNFTTMQAAARQLASIQAWPDHHRFVAAWIGTTTWEPLSKEALEAALEALQESNDDDCDDPSGAGDPAP
jgi:hypothetical protein